MGPAITSVARRAARWYAVPRLAPRPHPDAARVAELNQFGFDRATAIITGREPFSALDAAIRDWKSRGGDQIRTKFEQSLKESS